MFSSPEFEQQGFAITQPLLSSGELAALIALIEQQPYDSKRGGMRDPLDRIPQLRALAEDPRIRSLVDPILGSDAFIVRATLFDKTPDANWKVPWHQDLTIAVTERREIEGYGPWSTKEGVLHVQPPTQVLANMLTVRVHLDACPANNGALHVIPGSHHLGRINQNTVEAHIDEQVAVTCEVPAGAALVMRPLLLHASSASTTPAHRRVLHLDFANGPLTDDLLWRTRSS